jgi:hypothetical protein
MCHMKEILHRLLYTTLVDLWIMMYDSNHDPHGDMTHYRLWTTQAFSCQRRRIIVSPRGSFPFRPATIKLLSSNWSGSPSPTNALFHGVSVLYMDASFVTVVLLFPSPFVRMSINGHVSVHRPQVIRHSRCLCV